MLLVLLLMLLLLLLLSQLLLRLRLRMHFIGGGSRGVLSQGGGLGGLGPWAGSATGFPATASTRAA